MSVLLTKSDFLPKEGNPVGSDPFQADWIIGVFILAFILLAWVRTAYPFHLQLVLDSLRAGRFIRQRTRNEEALEHPASWILLGITICSGGLFLYQHHLVYNLAFLGEPGIGSFGLCSTILLVGILMKMLSLTFLRSLLGIDTGIREYKYHLLLIVEGLGLILLPLTILVSFMEAFQPQWGFRVVHPLLALAFMLLLYRAISIGKTHSVPAFYIFLYLCTLEILPLIVMSKAFIDHY